MNNNFTTNLNLYHIFYQTALAGNISLAAKQLYISQPAVSKAIARLEDNLNTTLFYRNSRGVKLTPEGTVLLEQLHHAFSAISHAEEELHKIQELGIGQITIGVSATLCKYVLLPHLQQYILDNPHVKVSIACQSTTETIRGLTDGTLDIGLIGESAGLHDLSFLPVMEIQDNFVTTSRYLDNLCVRLGISAASLYTFTDIPARSRIWQDATFLMLNRENISRSYIDSCLQQLQIQISQILETSTMDLLIEFAKIDMGIACVIENFVVKELTEHSLIRLPLPIDIPSRKIGLAWKNRTSPVDQFISAITSSME
ncbi:MAG: LysR family transcriptional regulator [Lachnospiraceae bacterium]|nr:LysR family transcriptional regulator [Lachnospiraceae bacterium]